MVSMNSVICRHLHQIKELVARWVGYIIHEDDDRQSKRTNGHESFNLLLSLVWPGMILKWILQKIDFEDVDWGSG
jgi:hypothetical protein